MLVILLVSFSGSISVAEEVDHRPRHWILPRVDFRRYQHQMVNFRRRQSWIVNFHCHWIRFLPRVIMGHRSDRLIRVLHSQLDPLHFQLDVQLRLLMAD